MTRTSWRSSPIISASRAPLRNLLGVLRGAAPRQTDPEDVTDLVDGGPEIDGR
jgi:hypothetical protein